jgi:hypothetical protein
VEAEEAVQVQRASVTSRLGNGNGRPGPEVLALPERHHHVQAVDGSALEHGNQQRPPRAGQQGARQERRREAQRDERHRAGPEEHSS